MELKRFIGLSKKIIDSFQSISRYIYNFVKIESYKSQYLRYYPTRIVSVSNRIEQISGIVRNITRVVFKFRNLYRYIIYIRCKKVSQLGPSHTVQLTICLPIRRQVQNNGKPLREWQAKHLNQRLLTLFGAPVSLFEAMMPVNSFAHRQISASKWS